MSPLAALLGWVGRHARLVLLAGLVVVPFLPLPSGVFLPLLPALVAALVGLALCRLDLPSLAGEIGRRSGLAAILAGIAGFQVVAAALAALIGRAVGLDDTLVVIAVLVAAAPTLTSAPNVALMLGYDTRLALVWTLGATFLAPVLVPASLWASGLALSASPAAIALKLGAVLAAGLALGLGLRRGLGARRIAESGAVLDGVSALVMLAFLFPLLDGVVDRVTAQPVLALQLAALALLLNLGGNLAIRWLAGSVFAPGRAATLGLVFGNRNIALMLAVLPHDAVFGLFVAMAQIPIYSTPLILRVFDRRQEARAAS